MSRFTRLVLSAAASLVITSLAYAIIELTLVPFYVTTEKEDPETHEKYNESKHVTFVVIDYIDAHAALFGLLPAVAVAWFTFTLKLSTDKLWAEGERQRKDVRKGNLANAIAARSALRSARAAEKGADTAEKALMALESPYITPIIWFSPEKHEPEIGASFRNVGRSPARLTKVELAFLIMPPNVYNRPAIAAENKGFMPDDIVAAGDASKEFYFSDPALLRYCDSIWRGEHSLHVIITYSWDSKIGAHENAMTRYIWHWRFRRFEYGAQLWDELPRQP